MLPDDVMAALTDARITAAAPAGPLGAAPASEIDKAVAMIRSAAWPVLLVGARGADVDACQAVRALLETTRCRSWRPSRPPVASRKLESCYVGRVGLFKNQPGDVVIAQADVLVTIGYDPVEYDPRLWNADPARTVIHIDSLPAQTNHYQRPWNCAATSPPPSRRWPGSSRILSSPRSSPRRSGPSGGRWPTSTRRRCAVSTVPPGSTPPGWP